MQLWNFEYLEIKVVVQRRIVCFIGAHLSRDVYRPLI